MLPKCSECTMDADILSAVSAELTTWPSTLLPDFVS